MQYLGLGVVSALVLTVFLSLRRSAAIHRQCAQGLAELRTIYDRSQVAIIMLRDGRRIYRANNRAAEIFAFSSPDLMLGRDVREFHINENSFQEFGDRYYARLVDNKSVSVDYQLRRRSGEHFWANLSGRAVEQGKNPDLDKGVIWVIDDITARKNAEAKLARSQLNLQAVFDNASEAMAIVKEDKLFIVNRALLRITGYTEKELIGKSFINFVHEEDRNLVMANREHWLAQSTPPGTHDFRILIQGGGSKWVRLTSSLIEWEGDPASLNLLTDITVQRMAAKAITEAERKYREIFENAPMAIFQATPEGTFTTVNSTYARIMGYASPEEMIADITDIATQMYVNPEERKKYKELLVREGIARDFEVELKRRDGSIFIASLNTRARMDKDGTVTAYDGFLTDITERKLVEDALRKAHDDLEVQVEDRTRDLRQAYEQLVELNQQKTSFLSSASHELRTPLTSVLGFAKLVRRIFMRHYKELSMGNEVLEDRYSTIVHNLEIIDQEGHRLTRLINDLLDINKIEAGRMEWRDEKLDPQDVVNAAVERTEIRFDRYSKINFRLNVDPKLPIIRADKDRVIQVLTNLLDNAVKFTRRGSVILDVLSRPGPVLELRVTDNGPGIPEEDRNRVFEKFYQSHRAGDENNRSLGTGLGLSICRQIMDHYCGTIRAEAGPGGVGSRFVVRFPASIQDNL